MVFFHISKLGCSPPPHFPQSPPPSRGSPTKQSFMSYWPPLSDYINGQMYLCRLSVLPELLLFSALLRPPNSMRQHTFSHVCNLASITLPEEMAQPTMLHHNHFLFSCHLSLFISFLVSNHFVFAMLGLNVKYLDFDRSDPSSSKLSSHRMRTLQHSNHTPCAPPPAAFGRTADRLE